MDADLEQVIRSIHEADSVATIYVTGGAAQAIAWLVGIPGASRTVLEASVLYSKESSAKALGKVPSQFSSADMAVDLAVAAYRKAADLRTLGSSSPILGIGAACALASEPPKRGEHRAYVAAHSGSSTQLYSLRLAKGARSRWQEEVLVSRLLIKALARASGAGLQGPTLDLILPPPAAEQNDTTDPDGQPPQAAAAAAQGAATGEGFCPVFDEYHEQAGTANRCSQ